MRREDDALRCCRRCRRCAWAFAIIAAAALSWAACGGGTSGSSGGGGADCTGGPFTVTCDQCVQSACCAEAAACYRDATCNACAAGIPLDAGTCSPVAPPAWQAVVACAAARCAAACDPRSTCNPVTNEGCTGGETCDLDQDSAYVCFAPASNAGLCAACSNTDGPFCGATNHCVQQGGTNACARFCCDDADCAGASCDTSTLTGGVGVCVKMRDAGLAPACSAPTLAPSKGACFSIPRDAGTD